MSKYVVHTVSPYLNYIDISYPNSHSVKKENEKQYFNLFFLINLEKFVKFFPPVRRLKKPSEHAKIKVENATLCYKDTHLCQSKTFQQSVGAAVLVFVCA